MSVKIELKKNYGEAKKEDKRHNKMQDINNDDY